MNTQKTLPPSLEDARPMDILMQFVGVFEEKGLLNQCLRIRHRNRRYWITCNETIFFAYRMNDHSRIPPGIPGWSVCIVRNDKIISDAEMSAFASTEPSVYDWFRCIANNDFEIM